MLATIQTSIVLQDNFSRALNNIIGSVNLGLSAMCRLNEQMSSPVDTASFEASRDAINQAAAAAQKLDEELRRVQGTASIKTDIAPAQWQGNNTETFYTSGVERFNQEIQSADNMLNSLYQSQERIVQKAAEMNFLPQGATADLSNVQNDLLAIGQRMAAIENNPLNVSSPAAHAELERLRTQLFGIIQQQQNLNRAVDNMDVSGANQAYLQLSQSIAQTRRYIRDNTNEQGRFNSAIDQGANKAAKLTGVAKRMVAAYASLQTVKKGIELSDQMTQTTARLNLLVDDGGNVEDLEKQIFASAQRTRGGYQTTADAVSKLGLTAGGVFSGTDEIIGFAEQLNKHFTVAGTSAQGIDAAMLQITQAMGMGVLRGEEFNSVMEQSAIIGESIAKALDVPVEKLRGMAEDGKITADVVKRAMLDADIASGINEKFESMPLTFAQIWTSFQNRALMAFKPVLTQINKLANSPMLREMVSGLVSKLSMVAAAATRVFGWLMKCTEVVYNNWSWIRPVIIGISLAFLAYRANVIAATAAQIAHNAVEMISKGLKIASTVASYALAAARGTEVSATTAATAAQLGLNTAMLACPAFWIVAAVIAVIAAIYAITAAINKVKGTSYSATGFIAGVFAVLAARIYNRCIVPLYNRFTELVNFFGNVFKNPVGAVKVLFYDMCLDILGYFDNLMRGLETLINKIPGVKVDITSGLDGFYAKLQEAQQNVKDETGWVEYVGKLDYMNYEDAYKKGYDFGKNIVDKVKGFIDDKFGEFGGDIKGISYDTGKISDSLDIATEDLKYLRDIAEREAVNRFTTAEITIEQTNHNNISEKMDLDGIVSGLTDAASEAVYIIAEGVHA